MNASKKNLHLEQQPPSRCLSDDIISCDSEEEESYKLSSGSSQVQSKQSSTISSSSLPPTSAGRRGLVHSVSIIVEPALSLDGGDNDSCCSGGSADFTEADLHSISHAAPTERRKTIAGPIVVLEDFYFDQPKKAKEYDDVVQSLFASARLRKEEFARLLEEHAQIVSEIKQAQKSLS